jgi:DNA-binding PadR family transcriptional regulator
MTLTPLHGALLGLLAEEPRSGYDLRRVFATTPMRHFSDSPGAIYPALRRLRQSAMISSTVDRTARLRPREVFTVTPEGRAALREWAAAPPTRDDVVAGVELLILRFVLVYSVLSPAAAITFLEELERQLVGYSAEVAAFLRAAKPTMHLGAQCGVENGLRVFDAHVEWCRGTLKRLRRTRRGK